MWKFLQILASALLFIGASLAQEPPKLTVENAIVSDTEGGAMVEELRSFGEREKVYLDFRIGNFAQAGDPPRMKVEYEVAPVDDQGKRLAPSLKGVVDEEITAQDKLWRPHLRYELEIPEVPRPAPHTFSIRLKDVVAGTDLTTEVPFRVYSRYPLAPEMLTVHDLRFYGSEYDEVPLAPEQALRRAERLFVRFFLTGFKFSPANGYKLEYGLVLKDPSGKTVLSVPKAAAESRESFYPKTFVPCAIGIVIDRKVPAGKYSITIAVRDSVGNQRVESVHEFLLE